ncbi:MAG: DUF3089 domain-containing protein [Alphaproteobacteria bacterium]
MTPRDRLQPRPAPSPGLSTCGAVLGVLAVVTLFIFRDNVYEFTLDPQQPFQTALRGAIPDYATPSAWAALPARAPGPADGTRADGTRADVFFVHGTTFAGDNRWNAPIDDPSAAHVASSVLPLEGHPFAQAGRLFAPYYRQATLYAFRTRSEDSRRARSLAYQDIRRAFAVFRDRYNADRPFVLAGIGQGGLHVAGLLQDMIAGTPEAARLIAAYILAHPVPVDLFEGPLKAFQPCTGETQTGCILSWTVYPLGIRARMVTDRSMIWDDQRLTAVAGREILCAVPQRFLAETPAVGCRDGILRVDGTSALRTPPSPYPRRPFHHLSVPLFEDAVTADVNRRLAAFHAAFP